MGGTGTSSDVTIERGLDDDFNDVNSIGEGGFRWRSRHQFAYPSLAKLTFTAGACYVHYAVGVS